MDLRSEIEKYLCTTPATVTVHEKLADFFAINRGDVVSLDGNYYIISGNARERSFGLDDEPKHWVKYAYDVSTGKRKVIKLVYLEQFDLKYGEFVVRCYRSPAKEGRALQAVKGHPYFMQGETVKTEADGEIRIIDYITGTTLLGEIEDYPKTHEAYFHEFLPLLLDLFLPSLRALTVLHDCGIRHGDIRSDHLLLDRETAKLRWIDFDYDFIFHESPFAIDLLGIGHMLSEMVGKAERTVHNLRHLPNIAPRLQNLTPADFSVVQPTRLMNWKKVYPYVPEMLNQVLMHFAAGAEIYYETIDEIVEDLGDARAAMPVKPVPR